MWWCFLLVSLCWCVWVHSAYRVWQRVWLRRSTYPWSYLLWFVCRSCGLSETFGLGGPGIVRASPSQPNFSATRVPCLTRHRGTSRGVICWDVGACSSYPQPSCCCRARQSRGCSPAKAASRMMPVLQQPPHPTSRLQCTLQTLHAGRRDRCETVDEPAAAGEAGSDGGTNTSLPPRHARHHSLRPTRLRAAPPRREGRAHRRPSPPMAMPPRVGHRAPPELP